MGLQRSDDGGRTWREVSLKGEASFLQLDVSAGLIYGYETEASAFMVSRDGGRAWETLSTLPRLTDFAVNPANTREVVALVAGALLGSSDGGATWGPLPIAGLVNVDWHTDVWGIDEAGGVHSSSDAGRTWAHRGQLPEGRPDAFLAAPEGLFVALFGIGIYASEDGGQTWQPQYLIPELQ
jgi:photosystem II stability/assembly factor-like uncharacterized protein